MNDELLMNPSFVNQMKETKPPINFRFYKKRIHALTKNLLCKKKTEELPETVKASFQEYVHNCVKYFEFIDQNDLIQKEYENMKLLPDIDSDNDCESVSEANKKMIAIKKKPSKIENLMDIYVNKPEPDSFPEQKELNIKDEAHKKKGLKKNIPK